MRASALCMPCPLPSRLRPSLFTLRRRPALFAVAMGFVKEAYGIDICQMAVATGEEFTKRLKTALGVADHLVTLQLKAVGQVRLRENARVTVCLRVCLPGPPRAR